jgi:hypothetical protein
MIPSLHGMWLEILHCCKLMSDDLTNNILICTNNYIAMLKKIKYFDANNK